MTPTSPPFHRPVPSDARAAGEHVLVEPVEVVLVVEDACRRTRSGAGSPPGCRGDAGRRTRRRRRRRARARSGPVSACSAIASGPWNSLASSSIAGWRSARTVIASLKKSPKSIGPIVRKPITTDGIASSDQRQRDDRRRLVRRRACVVVGVRVGLAVRRVRVGAVALGLVVRGVVVVRLGRERLVAEALRRRGRPGSTSGTNRTR